MSNNVKIELNSAGIREMLLSTEMQAVLSAEASAIAQRCGAGYESDVYLTKGRAVASCYTATIKAEKDNLENNTILRSLK